MILSMPVKRSRPSQPTTPLATRYIEFREKCLKKLTVILGGGQLLPHKPQYISCKGGKGFNQWRAHTDNIVAFATIDFLLPLVVCQNYTLTNRHNRGMLSFPKEASHSAFIIHESEYQSKSDSISQSLQTLIFLMKLAQANKFYERSCCH